MYPLLKYPLVHTTTIVHNIIRCTDVFIYKYFIVVTFSFFSHKVDLLTDERQVIMIIDLLHGMYILYTSLLVTLAGYYLLTGWLLYTVRWYSVAAYAYITEFIKYQLNLYWGFVCTCKKVLERLFCECICHFWPRQLSAVPPLPMYIFVPMHQFTNHYLLYL